MSLTYLSGWFVATLIKDARICHEINDKSTIKNTIRWQQSYNSPLYHSTIRNQWYASKIFPGAAKKTIRQLSQIRRIRWEIVKEKYIHTKGHIRPEIDFPSKVPREIVRYGRSNIHQ
jgi:hypothetical protein